MRAIKEARPLKKLLKNIKTEDIKKLKVIKPKNVAKKHIISFLREIQEVCSKHDMWFGGCGCCGSPFITHKGFVPVASNIDMDEKEVVFTHKKKKYTLDAATDNPLRLNKKDYSDIANIAAEITKKRKDGEF